MKEESKSNQNGIFNYNIDAQLEYKAANARLKAKGYPTFRSYKGYCQQLGVPMDIYPYQPNFVERIKDEANGNLVFRVCDGQYLRINQKQVGEGNYRYFITGDKGERFSNFGFDHLVFQTFEDDPLFESVQSLFELIEARQIPLDKNHDLQFVKTFFGYNLIIWDRQKPSKKNFVINVIGSKHPAYEIILLFYETLTKARSKIFSNKTKGLILNLDSSKG